jgi:5-methylcytosine-specific restriction endonuclease McrA
MNNSCPIPPYSSLKRSTKPIRARKKPQTRVGKLGIVRLSGSDLLNLRFACWGRDDRRCQICDLETYWTPRFDGDPLAYDMAHIKSRGAGGSDEISNVRALCHQCHMKEHTKGKS